MDGILRTHGKTLAGVGAILILVVAMVGEEDSPGVLSKVQEQAEAKKASGTVPHAAWFSPEPPPPPASSLPARSDGLQKRIETPTYQAPGPVFVPPASMGLDPSDFNQTNERIPPRTLDPKDARPREPSD